MTAANYLPANVRYTWDFGDGTPTLTVSTPAAQSHSYAAVGADVLTVTMTDQRNNQTIGRARAQIIVTAAP